MNTNTPDKFTLMCGKAQCCPEVELQGDKVILTDNDDGKNERIELSLDQAKSLKTWLGKKV